MRRKYWQNSNTCLRGWGLILVMLLVSWLSCGNGEEQEKAEESYQINRQYRRGPAVFRVAVSREEITIADRVDLLLEARVEEGYQVRLPRFGDKLEQFGIVDYTTPSPVIGEEGEIITRRLYELEPFLSGEYRIPPMKAEFWMEGDTLIHQVESDTIKVMVNSLLPGDVAERELKDIAPPAAIPAGYSNVFIIAAIAVVIAGTAVLTVWWRRRRRKRVKAPAPRAHQIAFARLEQLLARELVEQKKYREFTAELADILRYYIEDRFGIRAPEQTTEEFLSQATSRLEVDPGQQEILRQFLIHSDLVKFAALEPSPQEVKRSFETCRDFIETTKTEEEVKEEAA